MFGSTRALLTLFVFLLVPQASSGSRCDTDLQGTYWKLAPKKQQLLLGLLAEDKSGQNVLAVDDYFGGRHQSLYEAINTQFPVQKVLWAGELLLENPETTFHSAVIVFSINSSGYFYQVLKKKHPEYVNDPRELYRALSVYRPDLATPYTQHLFFDESTAHLDPFLQSLYQRQTAEDRANGAVRHQLLNVVNVIYAFAQMYKKVLVTSEDRVSHVRQVSPQRLSDIVSFISSRQKYSQYLQSSEVTVNVNPRQLNPNSREDIQFYEKLVEMIHSMGERAKLVPRNPEVIVLSH